MQGEAQALFQDAIEGHGTMRRAIKAILLRLALGWRRIQGRQALHGPRGLAARSRKEVNI